MLDRGGRKRHLVNRINLVVCGEGVNSTHYPSFFYIHPFHQEVLSCIIYQISLVEKNNLEDSISSYSSAP